MPYRGSKQYWSNADWYQWHVSQRAAVGRNFGGIDEDVTQAFFGLTPMEFEKVLERYEASYGKSAAQYARKAYRRWRSGATMVSGQTLERLLEVVPYVLSFDTKLRLYRKLRDAYRGKESVRLLVSSEGDLALVESTVARIVERAKSQPLPPLVDSRLVWLAKGDGLVARELVAASEEADGVMTAQALRSELPRLRQMFDEMERSHRMEHVISLPCGKVTVDFGRKKRRRWFMSNEEQGQETKMPARREDQMIARPAKDIFEFALQSMINPDDSQEIVLAAQREYLRLQAKKVEGEMDEAGAERELKQFIDQMREASALNVSLEASADFKRASGTTRMTVKKKSRWWPFG